MPYNSKPVIIESLEFLASRTPHNQFILKLIMMITLLTSCLQKGVVVRVDETKLGTAPQITSVSPNQGVFVGGTNVTITGVGFRAGSSPRLVQLPVRQRS